MKKAFTPYLLCMSLALLALSGCSKVSSDDLEDDVPYYQHYTVYYDGSNGSTRATGSFTVRTKGGTGITLAEESNLKVNGNATSKEPIISEFVPVYGWTTGSITDVTFTLNKKGGTAFVNSVKTSDIDPVAFPVGLPATFSKAGGISFSYVGNSGAIDVEINGKNMSGVDTSIEKTFTSNAVNFSSGELQVFNSGSIEIQMNRHKELPLQSSDDNAGGNIHLTYRVYNSFTLN